MRLYSGKKYIAKWFDPSTGKYYKQNVIVGWDENYTFTAPPSLKGKDAILYLKGEIHDKRLPITGHRGGKLWAPENTLAAYKKCADNNLDWETDLNLTSDGEIILMHDMTLDRTTDAETVFGRNNIKVSSRTLAEIKTLDAGSHFSSEYAGEKVPTLDEFLDYFVAVAPKNTVISMDTKLDKLSPGSDVYQRIIDKIAARDLFDRVFIEVFEVDRINNTRKLNNGDKIKYAIWVSRKLGLLDDAIESGYFSRIHSSNKIAHKVDDVHAGGIPYFASHHIESQEIWDAVKNFNIDGVSTDMPDVALWVMRNEIPMCSIKNPVDGVTFRNGATITIHADVGDTDSSITKVEFYSNGSLIGKDSTSPYSYLWTNVPEGRYALTAKVYDHGMSKVSAPIQIFVR
jgi:glycerophosphoryl diester phosphodiesterase